MSRQTYIGLPVRNLARATDFFTRIGFGLAPYASDEHSSALVISDDTLLLLHTHDDFERFTGTAVADPNLAREVNVGLSAKSGDDVDEFIERVLAAGGTAQGRAVRAGSLYMRAFLDLDGHRWSVIHFSDTY